MLELATDQVERSCYLKENTFEWSHTRTNANLLKITIKKTIKIYKNTKVNVLLTQILF